MANSPLTGFEHRITSKTSCIGITSTMPRSKLQRCPSCDSYGFKRLCDCGGTRVAVAPLKYSPEDPQGDRRRTREGWGTDEWVAQLPSPRQAGGEEE
ncbi:MAG: nucleolar RNA-binding Nop10p family protein [Candidatus Thalassarchaeaceae archaeon]